MVGRTLLFGSLMALCGASAFANIVTNGAFTTGDFTGWGNGGWEVVLLPADSGATPTDTAYAAGTGCVGPSCNELYGAFISQSLATVALQTYTLSFLYDAGSGSGPGAGTELDVFWDGNAVPGGSIVDATGSVWTQYTFTGLTASTNSTVLEFTGRQDPSELFLTDISATVATPEPASSLLLGGGLLALGALLRRRLRA